MLSMSKSLAVLHHALRGVVGQLRPHGVNIAGGGYVCENIGQKVMKLLLLWEVDAFFLTSMLCFIYPK